MKKISLLLLAILVSLINITAQETISSGRLSITLENVNEGIRLSGIKDNGAELLNEQIESIFFHLKFLNTNTKEEFELNSNSGWSEVHIQNNVSNCIIALLDPLEQGLDNSISAIITINTDGKLSSWDIELRGLVNTSLLEVVFPLLNFKADGDDDFLVPYFHGQLTHNPRNLLDFYNDTDVAGDDRIGLYPRGFGATMQFMAYYNDTYGIYFGFHDPKASLKQLQARNNNDGVEVSCIYPIPNMTIAGNDWGLPCVFELDLFEGDWYDASIHYRDWVSKEANYWPQESQSRRDRQKEIGKIGLWIYNYLSDANGDLSVHRGLLNEVADFVEAPVGVHWYEWNYLKLDDDYPLYFPEREGLTDLVETTQDARDNISIMPYINGRMFDQDISIYNAEGFPYATKHEDGTVFQQRFNINDFAVMCPTQEHWQNILTDAAQQITTRIGTEGIYVDQVGAASPAQCMDANHGHPLGGGSFWSDGYQEMFSAFHDSLNPSKYITTEGGCDFLANAVDGFMVQSWVHSDLVPAFSAVYSGKVQLFGTITGTSQYGNQKFYGKLAKAFTFGVQPGRQSMWLYLNLANANDSKLMAANYTKSSALMRSKLKDFMSFGEMQKPLDVHGSIPILNFPIYEGGVATNIDMPAIQSSVWKTGDSLIVLFTNARIQSPAGVAGGKIDFSFDFDGTRYGLTGELTIQEITPFSEGPITEITNSFTKEVSLENLDFIAFKIKMPHYTSTNEAKVPLFSLSPNPAMDRINLKTALKSYCVDIIDIKGRCLYSRKGISSRNLDIDISQLKSGLYFIWVNDSSVPFVKN